MNDVLKQRLVGALILVALGVVFWPIIFVEPESTAADSPTAELDTPVPPRPRIDTTPLTPPDRVGLRGSPPLEAEESDGPQEADAEAPEPAPVADFVPEPEVPTEGSAEDTEADQVATGEDDAIASRTREDAPVSPKLDDQGVPIAWMLQVISVSHKERAEETRQALQDMGHKAYVKSALVGGKTVYRVYVGPKFERARLETLRAEIDQRFGVQSMVRRYYP